MFVADEGCVLMSSDYSQQEPKVMTQMCGDVKMLNAYKEGKDLYAEIKKLSVDDYLELYHLISKDISGYCEYYTTINSSGLSYVTTGSINNY